MRRRERSGVHAPLSRTLRGSACTPVISARTGSSYEIPESGQAGVSFPPTAQQRTQLLTVAKFLATVCQLSSSSASSSQISCPSSPSRSVALSTTTYRGSWPLPSDPAPPTAPSSNRRAVLIARRSPEEERHKLVCGREGLRRSEGRAARNAAGGRKGWVGRACDVGVSEVMRS